MNPIDCNDFQKIELRVGTIIEVNNFPEAIKPAYQLKVDLGEKIGVKQSSAQFTELYIKQDLIGKQVIAVVNFPPKKIGTFTSECLVTGFYREDQSVVLAVPDKKAPNGSRLD